MRARRPGASPAFCGTGQDTIAQKKAPYQHMPLGPVAKNPKALSPVPPHGYAPLHERSLRRLRTRYMRRRLRIRYMRRRRQL